MGNGKVIALFEFISLKVKSADGLSASKASTPVIQFPRSGWCFILPQTCKEKWTETKCKG